MVRIAVLLAAPLALAACVQGGANSAPVASGSDGALFVAGKFADTLARIDLATGRETVRVDSCATPHELATSPDDQYVALACYGGTSVDIFRTVGLEKVKSIDLGENARPHGIVWHANGDLYATAEGRKSVFWIKDPLGAAETFEYGTGQEGTHMLVVALDGRHAWTTDLGSKTVTRVDLLTRRAPQSIGVGVEPEGIALAPDGQTLYVSARGSDEVYAIDPQSMEVRKTLAVGDFPLRIAVRPQGDFAVTSDLEDGGLTVIDLADFSVARRITVSSPAEADARFQVTILWSPDGERIYVAETKSDTIAEVDFATGTVLRRLPGTGGGDGMAIVE
ncbi:YncE family protein [Qipengyuania spongiae]|uniref:YncE family protein n=1 Tax=Qipengyuania spongiae TaxID=2909673 RepID=A0ABY5SVU4_9SPHN|nr:YncE family protein [Qipengyuania spongiae]UVI38685.1 YncE family protein [Qipengyuania spongiae]